MPYDTRGPFDPSGLRIGTPAVTTQGMGPEEMVKLADWMNEVAGNVENEKRQDQIAGEVRELCARFPAPGVSQG